MHQGQRPRNLSDISHLYLSASREQGGKASGSTAIILLASLEGGPLRAWLSAGLAAAFGSQNVVVTLLDAGRSLPNAGYYFALGPDRYLRPVLDEEAVVEADTGGGIRILCARDPALLRYQGDESSAGLRVILIAFDWRGTAAVDGLRSIFDALPAGLPAFLLTVSDCYPGAAEGILRAFDGIFPGGPAMALFPGGDEVPVGGIEPCPFPAELLKGLSRRKPPASVFLTGLAGEILQRLGSKKRGTTCDKIG